MNGPWARAEELWTACASSVFPVPVSPSKTIGTSDFAASLARLMQRVIAAFVVRRSSTFKLERRGSIIFEFLRAIAGSVRKHIQSTSGFPPESALHLSFQAVTKDGVDWPLHPVMPDQRNIDRLLLRPQTGSPNRAFRSVHRSVDTGTLRRKTAPIDPLLTSPGRTRSASSARAVWRRCVQAGKAPVHFAQRCRRCAEPGK